MKGTYELAVSGDTDNKIQIVGSCLHTTFMEKNKVRAIEDYGGHIWVLINEPCKIYKEANGHLWIDDMDSNYIPSGATQEIDWATGNIKEGNCTLTSCTRQSEYGYAKIQVLRILLRVIGSIGITWSIFILLAYLSNSYLISAIATFSLVCIGISIYLDIKSSKDKTNDK